MHTLVIAEIGVNHNGDEILAKEMVAAACETGVDVVKFQTYKAEEVMTDKTPLAGYMGGSDKNFLDLARRLELTLEFTQTLKEYTEKLGAEFMSSPFDAPSTYALHDLGVKRLKIPSGETVNPFVLKAACETQLPLILSPGMCTMDEVQWAVDFLKANNSAPFTLLHCTTQYPADVGKSNLLAMQAMKERFNVPVGYSDHTPGIEVSLAAVALGATVIEKHFTTDRNLPGPDQKASLTPEQFKALVEGTRNIEKAMGNGIKIPFPIELEVAKVARKSLVCVGDLVEGTVISWDNVTAKRPGTGIPAAEFEKYVGKKLLMPMKKDDLLLPEFIG
ncbi:MAG: N-acetylneuraminate synthase family protein [Lentisphaeraceae bacterium]|nr:N-acetylneuraminate synthase family protein [Lentisphaeraceae bacterium]